MLISTEHLHHLTHCCGRTNALQKAIFRAKNNGSSLKITLPFENILDIEQTEAFEFQKFLKIRAVGIDDSFVMDEVSLLGKGRVQQAHSWESSITLPISRISRRPSIG